VTLQERPRICRIWLVKKEWEAKLKRMDGGRREGRWILDEAEFFTHPTGGGLCTVHWPSYTF